MPLRRPMLTRMVGEKARRPQFVRVAEFLGLTASQVFHPSLASAVIVGALPGGGGHRGLPSGLRLRLAPRSAGPSDGAPPRHALRQKTSIRALCTRIAGSERERLISFNAATSTSFTADSNRLPLSRHDFLSMLPNQPSAYMPWRKTESSRIASIGSVSRIDVLGDHPVGCNLRRWPCVGVSQVARSQPEPRGGRRVGFSVGRRHMRIGHPLEPRHYRPAARRH
jgi:hypothetical protein